MDLILPILIAVLFLAGWSAFAISRVVLRNLSKAGKPYANELRIVTMIVSFLLILGVVFLLFIYNIRIER